jgi:hypothetical protein
MIFIAFNFSDRISILIVMLSTLDVPKILIELRAMPERVMIASTSNTLDDSIPQK